MTKPNIIMFGDSITEGYPPNRSYINELGVALISPTTQIIKKVADNYGWSYQNVGIAGETSLTGEGRIQRDVIDPLPKACIIQYGGNDWAINRTANEVFTSMSNMCDDLIAAGIKPIVCSCTPYAPLTDARSQIRRDYNALLDGLATTHNAIIVQLDSVLGKVRTSTGELDDLQDAYALGDNIHLNDAGSTAYANAIIERLDEVALED